MTLGDLIYQYRVDHKLSQRAFATKCGVSNVYINMLEKNMNPSTGKPIIPTITQLKAISDAMGYTLDEVMHMLDPESVVTLQNDAKRFTTLKEQKNEEEPEMKYGGYQRTPLRNGILPHHRDRPLSHRDLKKEQRTKLLPEMFESVLNPHFEKIMIDVDLTITVEDDSMYPTYQRNDILFIKEQDTLGFEGQIMAVMIDSNTTLVRHVYSDPSGGYTLVSDNPAYPPEIKTPKEHPDLSLIGWVCGYTRLYDLERWYRHD